MKYPTRLSDAVHILAFIALYPDCDLTSNKLAESIQTNPAYVRQLMSALRKGGLLVSVKGHPRPALAREPEKITLLDAYRAVEDNKPLLHQDIHTNPACGVGVNIQLVLRYFYIDVQKTAEQRIKMPWSLISVVLTWDCLTNIFLRQMCVETVPQSTMQKTDGLLLIRLPEHGV